jgi:hypothetical protein
VFVFTGVDATTVLVSDDGFVDGGLGAVGFAGAGMV